MDVEDAQECCNGDNVRCSKTSNNNSSLSSKVGQKSGFERFQDDEEEEETTQRVYDGNMAFGWQNSSRIVRVSRASGGKDRHSKVWTSKGLRDRRVRLSVATAIQFYDLQDRLGVDQPSKAVDWLIKAASDSITELPPLKTSSFLDGGGVNRDAAAIMEIENGGNDQRMRKLVRACSSSTSETSKGSGLSLSRSEGRVKARERARERAAKEKEKENPVPRTSSSFTELLTAGINNSSSAQDSSSIFGLMGSPSLGQLQMPHPLEIPHFSLSGYHNHQHHHHQQQQQHFSFMPETASDSDYSNLSFTVSSTSGLAAGFNNNRGTLQSNFLLPQHEHNPHRFVPLDEASNLRFLMTTTTSSVSSSMENHQHRQFPDGFDPGLHLYYDDGCRRSDHKGKGNS